MTENEWCADRDPSKMLEFLAGKGNDRKLRLLGCACSRRVGPLIDGDLIEKMVLLAEQRADKVGDPLALQALADCLQASSEGHSPQSAKIQGLNGVLFSFLVPTEQSTFMLGFHFLANAVAWAEDPDATANADDWASPQDPIWRATWTIERSEQASLLRDIFGNLFRPISLDPRWLTSTVVDIAQAIYRERAFDKMPIMADALMDAGCDSEDILQHCRGDGPHVRGCWVVDLLLGKE